jgi:FeS assembly SUF system protein
MFWRKRKEGEMQEPEAATVEPTEREEVPAPVIREPLTESEAPMAAENAPSNIHTAQLEGRIIEAISTIFDPEIPVNIYELGLIYDLHITADDCVRVEMTLTSPACPVAGSLPGEVEQKVREVEGVQEVALELVWDPPWTPDRMSEAARLELGFM